MKKFYIEFYSYNGTLANYFTANSEKEAVSQGVKFFFKSRVSEFDVKSIQEINSAG